MSVIFLDTGGLNPLACGIFATVVDDSGLVAASGYLLNGGILEGSVDGAVHYTASFIGTLAPAYTQDFYGDATGSDTTVLVNRFNSSTLSTLGYGDAIRQNLVRGYAPEDGTVPQYLKSGTDSFGVSVALLDAETQVIRSSLRLWTAQGPDLDSWIRDFFGSYLPRYSSEEDDTYRARAIAFFGGRNTLKALAAITQAFYASTINERRTLRSPNLAFDTQGSFDSGIGAYDTTPPPVSEASLTPTIGAWDTQSRPDLAAQYNIVPGYFVIVIGFSDTALNWYLDRRHVDGSAYLVDNGVIQTLPSAPDPRLAALIELVKAGGYVPVYQTITST